MHVLRELLASVLFAATAIYFVVSFGVVIQTLMTQQLSLASVLTLTPFLLLALSELLTPLAFLVGVLFTYGRLAADNEYLASQACGVHPIRMLLPVVAVGLAIAAGQVWVLGTAIPAISLRKDGWARDFTIEAIRTIPPSVTQFTAPKIGFYMSWARREGLVFEDVQIDYREHVGRAERVRVVSGSDAMRLEFTGFQMLDEKGSMRAGRLTLEFRYSEFGETPRFRDKEEFQSSDELVALALRAGARRAEAQADPASPLVARAERDGRLERKATYIVHRRAAWAVTALLFGLVGAPIAIWLRRGTRLAALVFGLGICFVLFFPLSKLGDALDMNRIGPPWADAWLATAVLAAVASAFVFRLVRR